LSTFAGDALDNRTRWPRIAGRLLLIGVVLVVGILLTVGMLGVLAFLLLGLWRLLVSGGHGPDDILDVFSARRS
jgi:hypothetical protein